MKQVVALEEKTRLASMGLEERMKEIQSKQVTTSAHAFGQAELLNLSGKAMKASSLSPENDFASAELSLDIKLSDSLSSNHPTFLKELDGLGFSETVDKGVYFAESLVKFVSVFDQKVSEDFSNRKATRAPPQLMARRLSATPLLAMSPEDMESALTTCDSVKVS